MPLLALEALLDRELVLVENERTAREQLAEYLTRRGLKVKQVESGNVAVSMAESAEPVPGRVFLVDIAMEPGDIDGIDVACRIQADDPYSSFIFVTGFSEDRNYRQRVEEAGIRVGGWIEKPLYEDQLRRLVDLIHKEMGKVKIRISMAQAREAHGIPPIHYLLSISSLEGASHHSIEELLAELKRQEDPNARSERDVMARDAEIGKLYDEIRDLGNALRGRSEPQEPDRPSEGTTSCSARRGGR
jgi:CheY-like chemotaxis protein